MTTSWLTTMWRRTLVAPHLPVAGYLIYVGTYALTEPDTRIVVTHLPAWFANSWSLALLLGGLLILVGTLTDSPRTEAGGHACHLAGLAIYTAAVIAAGLFGTGFVFVLATLAGVSGIRLHMLNRSLQAREVAGQIAHGTDDRGH